jgi:hypothetical protein
VAWRCGAPRAARDEDRRFRLAPSIDQVLGSPNHPRYLGGYVRLGTEFATEDHRYCLEAFRTGATVPFQGRSEAFADVVADSTAGLQVLSARKLLPELPDLRGRLDAGGTILEVGCGTGRHLVQLCKAFPQPHEPLPESLVFAKNGVIGRLLFMLELYQIFTTYYSMTMSPDHEPTAQEEVRRCLMCTEEFVSSWTGERVCKRCKSTAMWKQSGMGRTGHFSTFTRRPSTPP